MIRSSRRHVKTDQHVFLPDPLVFWILSFPMTSMENGEYQSLAQNPRLSYKIVIGKGEMNWGTTRMVTIFVPLVLWILDFYDVDRQ
jgi:hypothetical protein